ncbi:hypothetical protein T03_9683 [Trichinella britovi]|uniref:Uncharacterized protein n=1 Tax=Trichinella britovi TaxID=45882 RepID=A0A0V1AN80_TRIBR|nr:hypothetical protein T03_9683 [Trichinella britovi]
MFPAYYVFPLSTSVFSGPQMNQSSTGTTAHPYPHLVLFRYNAYL